MSYLRAFYVKDHMVARLPDTSAGKRILVFDLKDKSYTELVQSAAIENLRTAKAEFELWEGIIESGIFEGGSDFDYKNPDQFQEMIRQHLLTMDEPAYQALGEQLGYVKKKRGRKPKNKDDTQ